MYTPYKIVSFDLFDTLLVRPFTTPTDLFVYIERRFSIEGFAEERVKAERKVEQNTIASSMNEEYTLDEIYAALPKKYRGMKDFELEAEKKFLLRNEPICDIFLSLKTHTPVAIISDSYLPEPFIANTLSSLGLEPDYLFVSSTWKKTKRKGSLFAEALSIFNVSGEHVLHIGDNPHSDGLSAKSYGIATKIIPKCYDTYRKDISNIREVSLLGSRHGFLRNDLSLLIGMQSLFGVQRSNTSKEFWQAFGFKFGGPLVRAFCDWFMTKACEADAVIFVARDCYFVHKAFRKLAPNVKAVYLPLTRKAIKQLQSNESLRRFFYQRITTTLDNPRKILLVDAGTNNFTAQRFLISLGFSVEGAYWTAGNSPKDIKVDSFTPIQSDIINTFATTGAIEFILSAPEPPIVAIKRDGKKIKSVHKNVLCKEELYRIDSIAHMGNGILAYFDASLSIFGNKSLKLCLDSIIAWNLLWLEQSNTNEVRYINKICHASDEEHSEYQPQFSLPYSKNIEIKIGILSRIRTKITNYFHTGKG